MLSLYEYGVMLVSVMQAIAEILGMSLVDALSTCFDYWLSFINGACVPLLTTLLENSFVESIEDLIPGAAGSLIDFFNLGSLLEVDLSFLVDFIPHVLSFGLELILDVLGASFLGRLTILEYCIGGGVLLLVFFKLGNYFLPIYLSFMEIFLHILEILVPSWL